MSETGRGGAPALLYCPTPFKKTYRAWNELQLTTAILNGDTIDATAAN